MHNVVIEISYGKVKIKHLEAIVNFVKFDDFQIISNDYEVFFQGVLTNKSELINKYNFIDFNKDLAHRLYEDINFVGEFRGSFYGYCIDKIDNSMKIFNDHLGTKSVYYQIFADSVLVSTYFNTFFTEQAEVSIEGAKMLLSYGYMLDDNTILENVKKIAPGSIMQVDSSNSVKINSYFKLSPSKLSISDIKEDEIINKLDKLFRQAVKRQFDKDIEQGKKHLVALSGGLDSRMTSWVAHDLGYIDQLNFTFSQSDYLDETIPKKIAEDLKHEWIFKSLDNGVFLKDIDDITKISGGNVLYYGLAHGNSLMKRLNFQGVGLIHSGQLGDVVIGSFISNFDKKNLNELGGAYSKLGMKMTRINKVFENFEEKEVEMFYQRAINGANSGLLASNYYGETFSPFYDLDFFNFCLSIPIEFRIGHKLYKKWVLKKYPEAANYVWEKTGRKLNQRSYNVHVKGKSIPIRKLLDLVLNKLGPKNPKFFTKRNMNPLNYWYHTNEDIKVFQDNYFQENIIKVKNEELLSICRALYINGGAVEKNQVLTLLSLFKLHTVR